MSLQSSFPFQQKKIYLKEKKCFYSSASFSNRGNPFKEKGNKSTFLVTAHFVLSMVTFEAYKRIQVISQSEASRISNLRCLQLFDNLFYSGIESLSFTERKPGENLLNNGGKSLVA